VHLNQSGRAQAQQLSEALGAASIAQIFSSPLERAIETAEPLAHKLSLKIQITPGFNEVDFGDWTGLAYAELAPLEQWKRWNCFRASTRAPNGEMMVETQARFVIALKQLQEAFPEARIAIFSHADPIKAALMYYLGIPLDFLQRLEIGLASFSILTLDDWGAQVRGLNLSGLPVLRF